MVAPVGERSRNWGYVCGRCACLETALLGREFFLELLRARTFSQAHALLGRSRYGTLFPGGQSLFAYDHLLREDLRRGLKSIERDSPSPVPGELFLLGLELAQVHDFFAQQRIARSNPDEVRGWMRRVEAGYDWLGGLGLGEREEKLFRTHPVRAASLWVDAAFLNRLLRLGETAPLLTRYILAQVGLSSLEVCWRALRSGFDFEWLEAFFFRGALREQVYGKMASLTQRNWKSLAAALAPGDFQLEEESFSRDFSREADDHLTRLANKGRHLASGPERALYYLRRLWVENCNLRLCLAAVLVPLERSQVEAKLRYS